MDISAPDWAPGKAYRKHDVVKLQDLSEPDYIKKEEDDSKLLFTLVDDCSNYIITDQGQKIELDTIEFGQFFKRLTVRGSIEIDYGLKFKISPTIGYSAKVMLKKDREDSSLIDPNLTYFQKKENKLDKFNSIGAGVGLKFYDKDMTIIEGVSHRKTQRAMASSELSHKDWYRVQIDIHPKDIPANAEFASAFIFVYGHNSGGFQFRDTKTFNLSRFFYCKEDHISSIDNEPNYLKYWTQDFEWRPSYGSQSTFAAINESMILGEGSDYVNNMAINSLPLEINLSFNNRTDSEAKAIVHFLQEKHFPYESIFALDYKGERLLSSDVQDFNFIYTFPYRKDLRYTCVDFSHSITYRNNNSVQAKFICNTESTLRSVESSAGYNPRTDAVFPVYFNEETFFEKGKIARLDSFPIEEFITEEAQEKSDEFLDEDEKTLALTSLSEIEPYEYDENNYPKAGVLYFREEQDLKVGDCLYIRPEWPENSTYSVGVCKVFKVIDPKTFVFGVGQGYIEKFTYTEEICPGLEWPLDEPIKEIILDSRLSPNGDTHSIGPYDPITNDNDEPLEDDETLDQIVRLSEQRDAPVIIYKLGMCPEDCLAAQPILPASIEDGIIPHKIKNKITGEEKKRIIYLKNYRMLQMESDITPSSYALYVTPLSSFSLGPEDDTQVLIPAVTGKSSIYIEDPDLVPKYPWLQVRNFEHRPTIAFNINNQPKHYNTEFTNFYNKKYKKGINQNMSTFTVVFDKRDDTEAAEILQFLESHLGYKKFRFVMPRPYGADTDPLTTQSRPNNSTFYCPNWNHEIVYKNNHTISATFIESSTAIQEDLTNPKGPCFGAYIYNPITDHELSTYSSVAYAYHQSGLDYDRKKGYSLDIKPKLIEMVFAIDTSPSTTSQYLNIEEASYSKYEIIKDSILKLIIGYKDLISGNLKFPSTYDYGAYSVPDISHENSIPPWYSADEAIEGVIPSLLEQNYQYEPSREKTTNEVLSDNGYDVGKLESFIFKIEDLTINVGFSLIGDTSNYQRPISGKRMLDLPDQPKSFDKIKIFESLKGYKLEPVASSKNITNTLVDCMSQFYNSPKAGIVDKRMLFIISDFNFDASENERSLSIINNLKTGNSLAKRRPLDSILSEFGNLGYSINQRIYDYMGAESWKVTEGEEGDQKWSSIYNPDFTGDFHPDNFDPEDLPYDAGMSNPSWYNEPIETLCIPVGLGKTNTINNKIAEYASDYTIEKGVRDTQLYYNISSETPGSLEAHRAVDFVRIATGLSDLVRLNRQDGKLNMFSVTISNCGPNPIRLKNTIVSFLSESGQAEWTTKSMEFGIPKNNNLQEIEHIPAYIDNKNPVVGHGGQYAQDPNNEKLLNRSNSNILWHSFNTKYEVYRKGEVEEINGGWKPEKSLFKISDDSGNIIIGDQGFALVTDPIGVGEIRTQGVLNEGVAKRGFKYRSFESNSGIEIHDYNIINVSEENSFHGDYSHLPVIKQDESIDLFFGVKPNQEIDLQEKAQLFFYAEDLKRKTLDCYANFDFDINVSRIEGPTSRKIEAPKIKLEDDRCRGRVFAIVMCNSNAAKDDNFDLYLNDELIPQTYNEETEEWESKPVGNPPSIVLERDDYIGNVILAVSPADMGDAAKTYKLVHKSTDLVCPPSKLEVAFFDKNLIKWGEDGPNKIQLTNVKHNYNHNYGQLKFLSFKIVGEDDDNIELAEPNMISELEYWGYTGQDFGPYEVQIDSC